MPKIEIENLYGKILEVDQINKSLLRHFHDHEIDWMHACGGKGRCTTCKVVIKTGMENLSLPTAAERGYADQKALKSNERLSCQARITGDVVILVPADYKLPHVSYSD